MKRGTLMASGCITICFFSGFFLSEYIHSDKKVEKLSSALQKNTEDLIGVASPDFSFMDVSGQSRNISEWQDKVLVINFWATWCPPCLEEIPHFIALQEKYGAKGLQFLGIAFEGVDDVINFANKLGINYPLLIGKQEVIRLAGKLGNHFGGLPYTVILNRSGDISFIKKGSLPYSEAEQVITSLL